MSYSSAQLSATIIALHNADKPCIVGDNQLRTLTSSTCQWRTTGSWASGSDGTDANGAIDYLADGFSDTRSYPSSAQDPWYLIFDFGSPGIAFDSVFILNHNLNSISGMVVTLQIADSNTYVTNLATLATWTPGSSNKRLVALEMDHVGSSIRQYSAVRYVRLKFDPSTGAIPKVGEVIFGNRKQLKHNPTIPWDEYERKSVFTETISYSGRKSKVVHYRGQRMMQAALHPAESSYITDLWNFYKTDTVHGTLPFMWVDQPHTSPQGANFLQMDPSFSFPRQGPNLRELVLKAEEQGPNFTDLES